MDTKIEPLSKEQLMAYLYTKTSTCPVCTKNFIEVLVRRSKLRQAGIDRDFRIRFKDIDPNLYDVTLCSHCGYAALSNYFDRITSKQQEWIQEKITPNYKHVEYDIPLSPKDALARYKQALTCAQAINAKSSQKALICLKMAWIYRDSKDEKDELTLLKFAHDSLKDAYTNENFPLGNMDEHTAKYMIAELARRLGDFNEAQRLISDLITTRGTPSSIKERAQDLKDLVRDEYRGL